MDAVVPSVCGIAVRRCILQEEKTFFKQFKKQLMTFCNPRDLMA